MAETVTRDIEYWHEDTRMVGLVCVPSDGDRTSAAVLLIHDAFGISEEMTLNAQRLAEAGHPVFLADVWGERSAPTSQPEIGPLIGTMVADRERWMARVAAAHVALTRQPEFEGVPVALLGYCFGGSSALEYLRTGAEVAGVAAIHPGLDLLEHDWSNGGSAPVLACVGVDDPMADAAMRATLGAELDEAGIEWQLHLYSGTTHAFTSLKAAHSPQPELFAYQPRSAARAWDATTHFLNELSSPTTS